MLVSFVLIFFASAYESCSDVDRNGVLHEQAFFFVVGGRANGGGEVKSMIGHPNKLTDERDKKVSKKKEGESQRE